jgi:DNA mismatch repair protein MutL
MQQDLAGSGIKARPLLVPVIVKLADPDPGLLTAHRSMLLRLGLDVDQSGPQSVMVRSIPALLPDVDLQELLQGLLEVFRNSTSATDDLPQILLELLAAYGSIHVTRSYTLKEMEQELRLFGSPPFPLRDRNSPGLWRTLSITELQAIVNDRAR